MSQQKYEIEDFLKVSTVGGGVFTHDDSKIIFSTNTTGTFQIYSMDVKNRVVEQLTDFQDPLTSFRCSQVENKVIFSKAIGGNENTQIYSLDLDTKETETLIDKKEFRHNLGPISSDGKYIAYASNERNGKDFDVYVMNLDSKEVKLIFDKGEWSSPISFSNSGKYLVIRQNHSNDNNDLYLCNLEDNSINYITQHEGKVLYGAPSWMPDDSSFYLTMNKNKEFMNLAKYSLLDKKFEYVVEKDWDMGSVNISKDGKYLACSVNEEGYNKLFFYNPNTLEEYSLNLPIGQIGSAKFSRDSSQIIFVMGDSRSTTNLWMLNIKLNECEKLTDTPQGVPSEVMVDPELIKYKSFDGLEIPAFIYKPKDFLEDEKNPVVINIHGGPESQFRPGLDRVVQYLVYSGYVVVAPNIRGSAGYGKTYLDLDNVEKRMDSVKDIVALREYLEKVPEVNVDKIALMGGSYGGFMVLACMVFYPKLWAAGVDIVGIVNFITFLQNTAQYRRAVREAEYGSLENHQELLKQISPINHIENIQAPLLVIHGANDPRTPLSEAEQVTNKIKEYGGDVELIVYEDEGHGLKKLKNRLDATPKIVRFLDRVLKA